MINFQSHKKKEFPNKKKEFTKKKEFPNKKKEFPNKKKEFSNQKKEKKKKIISFFPMLPYVYASSSKRKDCDNCRGHFQQFNKVWCGCIPKAHL